jgi:heat shock protein HtpX
LVDGLPSRFAITDNEAMSARSRPRSRHHPLLEASLLLGGMAFLLGLSGWIVAGGEGALWILLAGAFSFVISGFGVPQLMLRIYRVRSLAAEDAPALAADLAELCRRAGISRAPQLGYMSNPIPLAFTIGSGGAAMIVVSSGLLRLMNARELAGILAHEVSHISRGDLFIMRLATAISHVTRMVAQLGIITVVINVSLHLLSLPKLPWLDIGILLAAPIVADLLQLALSRTRESEADLAAVRLTADPVGLAAALEKLDRAERSVWRRLFSHGRPLSVPSLLRTHPHAKDRIRRLLEAQPV